MRSNYLFPLCVLAVTVCCPAPTNADVVDFSDAVFAPSGSTYIDGGSGTASAVFSYDLLDGSFSTAGGPDGVNDITITFRAINGPNAYSGGSNLNTSRSTSLSTGHTMLQSSSGIRGRNNHGNNVASRAVTGDIVGYEAVVRFNGFHVAASDLAGVQMTSVNTGGEAFESSALTFLNSFGVAYGSATYDGFWDTPPIGGVGGSVTPTINSDPWATSGTGVFVADDTGTVDVTDPHIPTASSNGANNNANVSGISTGLAVTDRIGGFSWMVYLEDVGSLDSNGDGIADAAFTTTSTHFSGTLNGFEFSNAAAVPEPASSSVMLIILCGLLTKRRRG